MKQRLLVATCLVWLVALIHVSKVDSVPVNQRGNDLGRLLNHINNIISNIRDKRQCQGYMCSYSHLSSHAGGQAAKQAYMNSLVQCALDPDCDPGFRQKRHLALVSHIDGAKSVNSGASKRS